MGNDQNVKFMATLNDTLSAEKINQIAQTAEKVEAIEKSASSEAQTQEWQKQCQSIMLDMAKSIESLENHLISKDPAEEVQRTQVVECNDEPNEIMILGDSNTRDLKPSLLHDKKKVTIEWMPTLEEASDVRKIPKRDEPDKISDVAFLTGLNDTRDVKTSLLGTPLSVKT